MGTVTFVSPENLLICSKKNFLPQVTGHYGHERPYATVTSDRATPSEVTGVDGHFEPSSPVTSDRSERSQVTGVNGHLHRSGPSTTDGSKRSQVTGYKDTDKIGLGDKKTPPPSNGSELDDYQTDWKPKAGLYPKELKELKAQLIVYLKAARSDSAKLEYSQRIAAVDAALIGPKVKDDPSPALPSTVKLPMPPRMSAEKMRELGSASVKKMREAVAA